MTPGRRALHYESLGEVMPNVDRLLEGHSTVGNWSLAQICRHLATVMRRVVDLPASTPHDASQWVGEKRKRQFFESGLVPKGIPASPPPVAPHRPFGFLTREEWDRFHCIHCAHHLGFAVPAADLR
jgi:Protein of unknown function (DUF1569)